MTPLQKYTSATRREEEHLQNAVVQYFAVALPKECLFWHTPNSGKLSPNKATRLKKMGVKAGIPDLFLLYDGQLLGIELKIKGGRLSDAQKDLHPLLEAQGCLVGVCRSIWDVEAFLAPRMPLKGNVSAQR